MATTTLDTTDTTNHSPSTSTGFPFPILPVPKIDTSKLDKRDTLSDEMAMFHNIIIRGMNSIYEKAVLVSEGQVQAFIQYVESWCHLVHVHHEGEETVLFPRFMEKGLVDMETNKSQHAAFHQGSEDLEKYVKDVKDGKEKYDGKKLREKFWFADVLYVHLAAELDTIQPSKLQKVFKSGAEVTEILNEEVAHAIKNSTAAMMLPFIFTHHDLESNPFFMKIMPLPPTILGKYILPHWPGYSKAWQFAPFTPTGKPNHWVPPTNPATPLVA